MCGAIHGISRLRSLGHGLYNSGRLAGRRAGGIYTRKTAAKDSSQSCPRRSGLLHLLRLLDGIAVIGSMVVHVSPELELVRLLEGVAIFPGRANLVG